MAINRVIRYVLHASSPDVEQAMFDYATYVRAEYPDCHWSMFRDPDAPGTYIALVRCTTHEADVKLRVSAGTQAFDAAMAPLLASPPDNTQVRPRDVDRSRSAASHASECAPASSLTAHERSDE